MSKPTVAIVGRPNVGKSQLFNRLAGKRLSIVEDTPGVTRDRLYADCDWRGRTFSVIDTGGIEPKNDNEILKFMRYQAEAAIHHADVIIFITDLKTGVTASDEEVASMLQRSGKPIVLAVNKCDKPGAPTRTFLSSITLASATRTVFPRCTATAPATCSTRCTGISRLRKKAMERTTASALP